MHSADSESEQRRLGLRANNDHNARCKTHDTQISAVSYLPRPLPPRRAPRPALPRSLTTNLSHNFPRFCSTTHTKCFFSFLAWNLIYVGIFIPIPQMICVRMHSWFRAPSLCPFFECVLLLLVYR